MYSIGQRNFLGLVPTMGFISVVLSESLESWHFHCPIRTGVKPTLKTLDENDSKGETDRSRMDIQTFLWPPINPPYFFVTKNKL